MMLLPVENGQFSTSANKQRDQEQRRHEHQVQALQVEMRYAQEGLAAMNHELMQLNRDNVQWLERHGRLERERARARQASEALRPELDVLRQTAAEHQALKQRWWEDYLALNAVRVELAGARTCAKVSIRMLTRNASASACSRRSRYFAASVLTQLHTEVRDPETPPSVSVATSETRRA